MPQPSYFLLTAAGWLVSPSARILNLADHPTAPDLCNFFVYLFEEVGTVLAAGFFTADLSHPRRYFCTVSDTFVSGRKSERADNYRFIIIFSSYGTLLKISCFPGVWRCVIGRS